MPKQAPHRRCDLAAAAEMRALGEAVCMLSEPQLLSRCFQCRVARVTERTAVMASLAPCESNSPWLHALVDAARCCWPALWRMPKQAPHRSCDLAAAAEMWALDEPAVCCLSRSCSVD